jgi:hypothetical protein
MAQEGAAGCGSSKLDTPAAIRHIAALLDDIAAALLKGQKKSLIALPVDVANEVHGLQRFHDGFNLIDVVADYNALRETIQEFAEANRITVTGRVRGILDRVLDKAIGVAVETYSAQDFVTARNTGLHRYGAAISAIRSEWPARAPGPTRKPGTPPSK